MAAGVSKTLIINLALAHLKKPSITSISEPSLAASKAANFYDIDRREALRACDWNFAGFDVKLNLIASVNDATFDPTWATLQDQIPGWIYCYAAPPQSIRVRKIYYPNNIPAFSPYLDRTVNDRWESDEQELKWLLQRCPKSNVMAIYTQAQCAFAKITRDITDESQFDDSFVKGFAWVLASSLCMPLTADKELQGLVDAGRKEFFDEAKRKNGGEGTERLVRESPYENARD